jgi:hypothetical protein
MTRAFVFGNGESRKGIVDLEVFRGKGTIIGCNAIYREFSPDVLLAIDSGIIGEIKESGYAIDKYFVVPRNMNPARQGTGKVYNLKFKRFNNCGAVALQYAGMAGHNEAYLFGFDCFGGNLYLNTPFYRAKPPQDSKYDNFRNYMRAAMLDHPETHYINVIKDKDGLKPIKRKVPNLSTMTYREFYEEFINFEDQRPIIIHEDFLVKRHEIIKNELEK